MDMEEREEKTRVQRNATWGSNAYPRSPHTKEEEESFSTLKVTFSSYNINERETKEIAASYLEEEAAEKKDIASFSPSWTSKKKKKKRKEEGVSLSSNAIYLG